MNKKSLRKIMLVAGLTVTLMGTSMYLPQSFNGFSDNGVAYAMSADICAPNFNKEKIGMETNTGWVTSKIEFKPAFKSTEEGMTLDELKAMSETITEATHPQLFKDGSFEPKNMNLTGKIYHIHHDADIAGIVDDVFFALTKTYVEPSETGIGYVLRKEYVIASTSTLNGNTDYGLDTPEKVYYTGEGAGEMKEFLTKEQYPSKPTEPEIPVQPEEPSKPTEPEKPTEPSKPEVINYVGKRLAGYDRYETASAVANEISTGKVDSIVLASGLNFPDALTGSVLATKNSAPILLTHGYDRDIFAINYAKAHLNNGGKVYVLGGTSAVSDLTLAKFRAEGINNIERIGGLNRYETNVMVANKLNVPTGTPVVIANANTFADSMSISGIAGSKGYPILLTDGTYLEQSIKDYIAKVHPSNIYVVGGTSAVGNFVESQLKAYAPVERLGGLNRYETSVNIAKRFSNGVSTACVATGLNFPDALTGSALAGKTGAPILLVNKYESVSSQKAWLDSSSVRNLYFLGGSDVVIDSQATELSKAK